MAITVDLQKFIKSRNMVMIALASKLTNDIDLLGYRDGLGVQVILITPNLVEGTMADFDMSVLIGEHNYEFGWREVVLQKLMKMIRTTFKTSRSAVQTGQSAREYVCNQVRILSPSTTYM